MKSSSRWLTDLNPIRVFCFSVCSTSDVIRIFQIYLTRWSSSILQILKTSSHSQIRRLTTTETVKGVQREEDCEEEEEEEHWAFKKELSSNLHHFSCSESGERRGQEETALSPLLLPIFILDQTEEETHLLTDRLIDGCNDCWPLERGLYHNQAVSCMEHGYNTTSVWRWLAALKDWLITDVLTIDYLLLWIID